MSVWAILVAAGRGERLGLDRPKAFAKLGDEPLLAEPLRRLEACPWVDGIVLVAPPGWEEPAILVAEEEGCGKVHACGAGGETRSDSVRVGLAEVPDDALVVLVQVLGVHELGGEDLLRLHEHLLLAGGQALLAIAESEVPDDLRELEDVTRLHLVAVVLETAVPVLRHLR